MAARRFHKFFNVNERPDTHESLLDLTQPHRLLVKHDGSLVGPILMKNGSVKFATSERLSVGESGFVSSHNEKKRERFRLADQVDRGALSVHCRGGVF